MLVTPYMMMKMLESVNRLKQKYRPAKIKDKIMFKIISLKKSKLDEKTRIK